jgi:hypothetical protein
MNINVLRTINLIFPLTCYGYLCPTGKRNQIAEFFIKPKARCSFIPVLHPIQDRPAGTYDGTKNPGIFLALGGLSIFRDIGVGWLGNPVKD